MYHPVAPTPEWMQELSLHDIHVRFGKSVISFDMSLWDLEEHYDMITQYQIDVHRRIEKAQAILRRLTLEEDSYEPLTSIEDIRLHRDTILSLLLNKIEVEVAGETAMES
jgi:hypothetical protein